ncbi:MAG: type II secretion system minor pseudopilin GspH [Gammaproteobacteria bacterium]
MQYQYQYRTAQRGFSLLELLVVVVIIGVISAIYTLSFGLLDQDREMERDLERLVAIIELASEESMLYGREMGVRFFSNRYEFSRLDITGEAGPEWVLLSDDVLRPREFDERLELELMLEGQDILLRPELEEKEKYQPQIFIYSSGEVTPFMLSVRPEFTSEGYSIQVNGDGSAEIKRLE